MPWNISASRQGSVRPFSSALPSVVSSNHPGLPGLPELGPPSGLSHRRSRLVSASPLLGRGGPAPRFSSLELSESTGLAAEPVDFGEEGMVVANSLADLQLGDDDEFQLYGPGAAVSTQTAAQTQWVRAALDAEAHNFLDFLRADIHARGARDDKTSFETLLPPVEHTKTVAAQALLHVLTLATRDLVEVRQRDAYGDIEIGMVVLPAE